MLTLREAADQIRTRQLSPVELTRHCLARIERFNPVLNAFITVTSGQALDAARRAEAEIASGHYRGPLHGLPIGLKDLFDTAGVLTTAGSNQYRTRVPAQDAEAVRRLQQAGALLVGKLNLHEFAFGISGVVSAFGPTTNPWDPHCISGGSSSGSAAAVAGGMCLAALGTDTSGSMRVPAALCGIVGHRPSQGLVSTTGVVPLCPSFDTVGPLTPTVWDAATVIDALTGHTSFAALLAEDVSQLKVGIARPGFFAELQPEVAQCMDQAIAVIGALVAEVREVDVATDSFRTLFDAEIYEYHETMASLTPQLYDPRTLYRVQQCAGISATAYLRDQRRLAEFRSRAEQVFQQVDVVLTPTVPVVAPRLDEMEALAVADVRPYEVKYLMRNTAPFSSLFWPTTSVPCGFSSDGLPVGLQLSARPGADSLALRLAHAYEQATEWRRKQPLAISG